MRRTLAIALATGLLLLGGCGRAKAHQPEQPAPAAPAAVTTTAPGANAGNGAAGNGKADSSVDNLLDQVGQQLSNDDQPAEDED